MKHLLIYNNETVKCILFHLQPEYSTKMSSKGKIPWIHYNDEVLEDSSICINYFKTKLNIDLDSKLDEKDKAISRAFQKMIEENLFWSVCLSKEYFCNYMSRRVWIHILQLN